MTYLHSLLHVFSLGLETNEHICPSHFRPLQKCPSFHEQTAECLLLPPDGKLSSPPLISFCSSRCASHCLVCLAHRALHTAVTDLSSVWLLELKSTNWTKSNKFISLQLHQDFSRDVLDQVLLRVWFPLESQPLLCSHIQSKVMADMLCNNTHVTMSTLDLCWDTDGKLRRDFSRKETCISLNAKKRTHEGKVIRKPNKGKGYFFWNAYWLRYHG